MILNIDGKQNFQSFRRLYMVDKVFARDEFASGQVYIQSVFSSSGMPQFPRVPGKWWQGLEKGRAGGPDMQKDTHRIGPFGCVGNGIISFW